MESKFGIMLLICFMMIGLSRTANANSDAERLYDDLINGYNSLIRPVGNNSDRLTVKMALKLSQLIEVVSLMSMDYGSFILLLSNRVSRTKSWSQ